MESVAHHKIIAHEYGHFVLFHAFGIDYIAGTRAFHEGFADVLAQLLYDTGVIGQDYRGCDEHFRWPRFPGDPGATPPIPPIFHTFPMCEATTTCSMDGPWGPHCRGELLSSLWLDLRDAIGVQSARDLHRDWMLIAQVPGTGECDVGGGEIDHVPQSADPGTLVEVLDVADPDLAETICQVFEARAIFHPDPTPNICQESAGWPCYVDCDSSGVLDFWDFLCFQNAYLAGDPYADCDGNGRLDFVDLLCFQSRFIAACP